MAGEFSDSPFSPPKDLAGMELLYPTGDVYQKHEAAAVAVTGAIIVIAAVLMTILGFQYRYSTRGEYIDPTATIVLFTIFWFGLRYWATAALTPVRLFFDKEGGKVVVFTKKLFGVSRRYVDAKTVAGVEIHEGTNNKWEMALNLQGGERVATAPTADRVLARHGAERAARFLKMDITVTNAAGSETARRKPGVVDEPYYKRLQGVRAPLPRNDVFIQKTKGKGGVKYDISLPLWIASSVFGFALMNLGIGIYIWMAMEKDTARWASIPFVINTFIVFVIAAMLHNLKRQLEVTTDGVTVGKQTVPLRQLSDIVARPGLIGKLVFESDTDSLAVSLSKKQLEWLKEEIDFEVWSHRPPEKKA